MIIRRFLREAVISRKQGLGEGGKMKVFISCITFLFMFLCSNGICQDTHPEVARIDATMALYMYKHGSVVVIGAMGLKTFAKKHILGSIYIPMDGPQDLERVRNMELLFPKEKQILVYCM
jgi:hypothetical protein